MKKIIVIGGGAAGAKAASKAKRLNPNNYVEMYIEDDEIAYSLCGLPYYIGGCVNDINKLRVRSAKDFLNNGIEVFFNSKLQKIFPDKKCVLIDNNHIFYDELILALGAHVNIPKIENINANNIFTLHKLISGVEIRNKMLNSKKALIVGGGYIAIELCEAFIKNGLEVVIIEKNEHIANDFDEDFSKLIQEMMVSKCSSNINLILSSEVVKIKTDENNNFISAITDKNEEIEADFCVLSTGASPNIDIAKDAGITIGRTGAIQVDNRMRTNIENIFACGDCCEKYSAITKEPMYIGLGTIANKEGRVAAINAVGGENFETFDGILGSTITRFFDYTISKTGMSYKKALKLKDSINIEPIFANITKKDKAGYMPNAGDLTIKLIADKRSGELLGAQGIGLSGNIAQRINTITSLLKTRSSVDDLLHLDLPYAPPYSSSIDPILTAAYKLREIMNK